MRSIILFMIFLILSFFLNVIFYYVSEDYRFFLKNVKTDENIITDTVDNKLNNEKITNPDNEIYSDSEDLSLEEDKIDIIKEVKLWKNYKDVLSLFSLYDFKLLEVNSNLFDVTNEYPDNYIEYYSRELTVYFFTTKSYEEIYDIFDLLSSELPFKINEVNNFWDKSFYINLNEEINDNYIRLVISYKWISFWLKIKNNEYNLVKEKLNTLRNNN